MRLFDAHCHLQDERTFAAAGEIIARAREAGVRHMLCCGTRESDWEAVRLLAGRYREIVPAFGLHPWFVNERSPGWLEKLETFLTALPHAAVGEIGLDHALDRRNDGDQATVLIEQLTLARSLRRPVSIHCRKAWGDMVRILNRQCGTPDGGAIHSYSGPPDLVRPLEELGLSLSFSGSLTYDRNRRGRLSAATAVEERLLVETDAPDISPVGIEQGKNEPAFVIEVVREIAEIRGKSVREIAEITCRNGERIFRPDETGPGAGNGEVINL